MQTTFDLDKATIVARVSSHSPGRTNWTVLTLYRTDQEALFGPIVAEIVGETTQAGQERRVRRASFHSVSRALGWRHFDKGSALFEQLRQKIVEQLQPGGDLGQGSREQTFRGPAGADGPPGVSISVIKPAILRTGFDGAGGLQGALGWLYPGNEDPREVLSAFCEDFGIDFHCVAFALDHEAGRTDDHQQPHPGNLEWIKAFLASLRFFDREAFWANRSSTDAR